MGAEGDEIHGKAEICLILKELCGGVTRRAKMEKRLSRREKPFALVFLFLI
jgi:hypothetical protein